MSGRCSTGTRRLRCLDESGDHFVSAARATRFQRTKEPKMGFGTRRPTSNDASDDLQTTLSRATSKVESGYDPRLTIVKRPIIRLSDDVYAEMVKAIAESGVSNAVKTNPEGHTYLDLSGVVFMTGKEIDKIPKEKE
jgi:hypothetical protein